MSRGRLREAATIATRSAELFRDLSATPISAQPYDLVLLAAALNVMAIVERESGRPDAARPIHADAIKQLEAARVKPMKKLNVADVLHFLTSVSTRTMPNVGVDAHARRRGDELERGSNTVGTAEQGQPTNPDVPRSASGDVPGGTADCVQRTAGRMNRADLEKSRDLLEAEVRNAPDVPSLHGDLGRTYAGLAQLARAKGNAEAKSEWFRKAEEAFRRATDGAPEHAQDRRDLEAVRAERISQESAVTTREPNLITDDCRQRRRPLASLRWLGSPK